MALFERAEIKTPEQIDLMRRAGLVVGRTLELLSDSVRPGMTTGELDAIAEESIRSAGATPTFRNWDYPQRRQIFAGLRIAKDL